MRIALASDAWAPQVNGVVRTLMTTVARLGERGHLVETITPDGFHTVPCPTYPEIRLSVRAGAGVAARLNAFAPDAVHIATEGPLGWATRRWCLNSGMPFTTSFHTRFPDYLAMRTGLPADLFWPMLRRFHGSASATFAATPTLASELRGRGLANTHIWSRGVDLTLFTPDTPSLIELEGLPKPLQLYVGRVAPEKNIAAFLRTTVPGTKIVVGDGPARTELQKRHPDVVFLGALHGTKLASAYASADVFVFPSLTDTFGLVMVEALASGVPVAAFPVPGPIDIIGADGTGMFGDARCIGALSADLDAAIIGALTADRADCAAAGRRYDWERCTDQFINGLQSRSADPRRASA